MRILALECSSRVHSAAMTDGDGVLAEEMWQARPSDNAGPFSAIRAVLQTSRLSLDGVDVFVAGVGPGSFTGIRSAVAALSAMSLPGSRPVLGVCSAEAMARQAASHPNGSSAQRVVVVGDARRGLAWVAVYRLTVGWPEPEGDIRLMPLCDIGSAMDAGTVVVSPDSARIAQSIEAACRHVSALFLEPVRHPYAPDVASIAMRTIDKAAGPFRPPIPLYLHAAVSPQIPLA